MRPLLERNAKTFVLDHIHALLVRESMESRETVGSSSVSVHEDAGMEGITCLVKANAVENVGKTRVAAHRIEEGQSCGWRSAYRLVRAQMPLPAE
jgi:hypothetical protein